MLAGHTDVSQGEVFGSIEAIEERQYESGKTRKRRRHNCQRSRKELQPVQQPSREQPEISAYGLDSVVSKPASASR